MSTSTTPSTAAVIACPHCHQRNRVAGGDRAEAHCGRCGKLLFEGHPAALDKDSFERHLANTDTPLVVDFWAPWCGPCRAMAPAFERAAQDLEPDYRLAKVNTDEEQDLASRYAIRSIPTIALFKGGVEVARVSGAMDAGRLAAWVRANG